MSATTDTDINVNHMSESNNQALPKNGKGGMPEEKKTSGDPHGGGDRDPTMPPAPDGGWGWMVVFGSFMVHVIADGIAYSFGIYVEEFVDYFECSHSEVGMLGSLMLGVTWGTGPIASVLVNKFGCKAVCVLGTIVASAGFLVSIAAPNIWFMFFSFGIVAGFGLGLAYLPAIVMVSFYFEKRRSLATGIAVCGSGLGTFIFAPITNELLEEYGWKGTVIIETGLLLNCIICGMVFRPLEAPTRHKGKDSVEKELVDMQSDVDASPDSSKTADESAKLTSSCLALSQTGKVDEGRRRTQSESWLKPSQQTATATPAPVQQITARKDIFYTHSLDNIPMYKNDPDEFRKSMMSLPKDEEETSTKWFSLAKFKKLMDLSLMLDIVFVLFAISNLLTSIGFVVPYIFLADRGSTQSKNAGYNEDKAKSHGSWLVAMVGISNTIGRVVFGYIADFPQVNRLMMYNTVLVLCGLVSIFSFVCVNFGLMMTYSFCFGLLIGVYTCLTPIVLVDLLGLGKLSNAFGLVLLFQGIGAVVGPPLAGAIYDSSKNYDYSFIMMGVCLFVSGAMLYPIPCIRRCQTVSETDVALGKLPAPTHKPTDEEIALNKS